ncbi:MAG: hypothetical protein AAGG57_02975 [Pseudomonadota bacterium]
MKHMIVGILLSLGALPLAADPKTDADCIASQVASVEVFDSAIKAQAPIMKSAIENDLRKKGITLSDIDVFFDIFFDEFLELFVEKCRPGPRSFMSTFFHRKNSRIWQPFTKAKAVRR